VSAKSTVVTLGNRRYQVARGWARMPVEVTHNVLTKGAADASGNIYLCQRADPPVLKFDRNGAFVAGFGAGLIDDAHGIFVGHDGGVWVVDRDGQQVVKFTQDGTVLITLGERQNPKTGAPFNHPTDVAEGPSGDIYVTDGYGNAHVHRFSPDGVLRRSWGGFGSGPGQFSTPHGIKVARDGRVFVGDRENNRIQIFDADGVYLTAWRDLYHPMDLHIAADGLIFVTDQTPSLQLRAVDGTIMGRCRPSDANPHGITGDANGNIFIVESRTRLVARFSPIV